jgi:hypothetical protein
MVRLPMVQWIHKHRDLLIVLAVIFGLYGASWAMDAHTRATQEKQGIQIERRLCQTLGALSQLNPPSGSQVSNPARGYEQNLQKTLAQLGPDLGCQR